MMKHEVISHVNSLVQSAEDALFSYGATRSSATLRTRWNELRAAMMKAREEFKAHDAPVLLDAVHHYIEALASIETARTVRSAYRWHPTVADAAAEVIHMAVTLPAITVGTIDAVRRAIDAHAGACKRLENAKYKVDVTRADGINMVTLRGPEDTPCDA